MKRNETTHMTLHAAYQKIARIPQKQMLLAVVLISVLLVLSLGLIQGTLGMFSQSLIRTDSATAAKFDVTITSFEEILLEQDESVFECHFRSGSDAKDFDFQIKNNGESAILCIPHVSDGVTFQIFIAQEECTDFILRAKEAVIFKLVITPDEFNTNTGDAEFFIDIQQAEGG